MTAVARFCAPGSEVIRLEGHGFNQDDDVSRDMLLLQVVAEFIGTTFSFSAKRTTSKKRPGWPSAVLYQIASCPLAPSFSTTEIRLLPPRVCDHHKPPLKSLLIRGMTSRSKSTRLASIQVGNACWQLYCFDQRIQRSPIWLAHMYPFAKRLMSRGGGGTPTVMIVLSRLIAITISLLWVAINSVTGSTQIGDSRQIYIPLSSFQQEENISYKMRKSQMSNVCCQFYETIRWAAFVSLGWRFLLMQRCYLRAAWAQAKDYLGICELEKLRLSFFECLPSSL